MYIDIFIWFAIGCFEVPEYVRLCVSLRDQYNTSDCEISVLGWVYCSRIVRSTLPLYILNYPHNKNLLTVIISLF